MARSPNVVGAHILVFLNGRLFGQATDMKWDSVTPNIVRYGLDSLTGYELAPGPVKVQGTIAVLRRHADGGIEGAGATAPFSSIERERYFSLLVMDRATGLRIFQADRCKVISQSWSIGSRGRMQGSFTFEALEWANESSV